MTRPLLTLAVLFGSLWHVQPAAAQCPGGRCPAPASSGGLYLPAGPPYSAPATCPTCPAVTPSAARYCYTDSATGTLVCPAVASTVLTAEPFGTAPGPDYRWRSLPGIGYGWVHASVPDPAYKK